MGADGSPIQVFGLSTEALGRLMPLHLRVAASGRICGAGPTLEKLFPDMALPGQMFDGVFTLLRPRAVADLAEVARHPDIRLKLALRDPPHTAFKGIAVPLDGDGGVLLNLSFGIAVADAVRDHRLTDTDFAPTDLTVEMLYLVEAKSAVLAELRRLNLRLQSAKSEAERQALTDPLTGLCNRRAMDEVLAALALSGMPFGLMHVDLDFFKEVNDTHGHAAGDHVLVSVGRILSEEVRASDCVARVGGDEFVMVIPGLAEIDALRRIGERVLARLHQPILFEGVACKVSASIGITSSDCYDRADPDTMLSDADRALYASKHSGRGAVTVFGPHLEPAAGL